jgi:hypothetical protein
MRVLRGAGQQDLDGQQNEEAKVSRIESVPSIQKERYNMSL